MPRPRLRPKPNKAVLGAAALVLWTGAWIHHWGNQWQPRAAVPGGGGAGAQRCCVVNPVDFHADVAAGLAYAFEVGTSTRGCGVRGAEQMPLSRPIARCPAGSGLQRDQLHARWLQDQGIVAHARAQPLLMQAPCLAAVALVRLSLLQTSAASGPPGSYVALVPGQLPQCFDASGRHLRGARVPFAWSRCACAMVCRIGLQFDVAIIVTVVHYTTHGSDFIRRALLNCPHQRFLVVMNNPAFEARSREFRSLVFDYAVRSPPNLNPPRLQAATIAPGAATFTKSLLDTLHSAQHAREAVAEVLWMPPLFPLPQLPPPTNASLRNVCIQVQLGGHLMRACAGAQLGHRLLAHGCCRAPLTSVAATTSASSTPWRMT